VATLADAVRQPTLPCYAEQTVFRPRIATADCTGATVIKPAEAELVPKLAGSKVACSGRGSVLPAQMPHLDAQKARIARRCGRRSSHGSQCRLRKIRHIK